MQRKKTTIKQHRHHVGGGKNQRDFLRLDPHQLIGNNNDSILYRLLKTGLRDTQMSKDVQLLNFEKSSFVHRIDLDAVFIERLYAYIQTQAYTVDPYWFGILSQVLNDKIGMRFIENGKRYYVFPTCVFVTVDSDLTVSTQIASPTQTVTQNATNNYHQTYKYQHSEDEANALLDERRREDAKLRRMTVDVRFYGFSIQVNDGLSTTSVLSNKRRGGDAVDNRTYYQYVQLQQIGKQNDIKLSEDIADAKLEDTSNTTKRIESAVSMIRHQLKKLFDKNRTNHVVVEVGDPTSSNSSHFNVKYDMTKHRTAYDASKHSSFHKNAYYRQYGKDQKKLFNLDETIDKQLRTEDIKEYLTMRGDLSSQKRVVLRYYHNTKKEQRYIIYSFHITNAASKLAGDSIHIVTNSLKPNITDPSIRIYALREYTSQFWLSADMSPASDNTTTTFDPQQVTPKLVPVDEDEDSSSESSESTGKTPNAPNTYVPTNDPLTDSIVNEYKALVQGSAVLTFFAFMILSVVQTTGGSWSVFKSSSDQVLRSGDGVYRNMIQSSFFSARRENHNEVFRFNTSYLFMHILMSASQQLQCVSYGRSSVKNSWFSGTVKKGRIYNLIAGADTLQGAGNGLFHDQPAVFEGNALSKSFLDVLTKNMSSGTLLGNNSSFKSNQSTQITSHYILENIRLFYKKKLQSLVFHLRERDDPEEFIWSLSRRNFWEQYSKRIQLIHGPFYKDIVQLKYHDHFLKHLFYYQLKHVVFPKNSSSNETSSNDASSDVSNNVLTNRIPTYYTTQSEFTELITDAHRTLLTLRSLQFEPSTNVSAYNLNLLQQFGTFQKTSARMNMATARNKTATEEMIEMMKDGDTTELDQRISELMKAYKIQDRMFLIDLQRKNTRLLFHFLHMVENNGMLDTLGNLNVTYNDIKSLYMVLQHALTVNPNESGGNMFPKSSYISSLFTRGTLLEKIGNHLFSMEPYLTLDNKLIQKLNKKNGFRLMLQEWSNHGNMFWNIIDFKRSNSFFAKIFQKTSVESFSLYVFLPSHIYLTREIRNIMPHLEKNAMGTMASIIHTHEAFQDKDPQKIYNAGGIEALVRGLIFGIQKDLLQTSETNIFIVQIKTTGGHTTFWMFGHWRRQYVLYDLGNNLEIDEAGLNRLHVDSNHIGKSKHIQNLLDDQTYTSSEHMLHTVQRWREEVEARTEQQTTVHQEVAVRKSMRRKRSSIRNKVDKYKAVHGENALDDVKTTRQLTDSVVFQKEKVYAFVKVVQFLAFQKTVLPTSGTSSEKLFDTKPYQNNPMCAVMWLIFRDLYTFLPGMYNHVMTAVNDRMRYCEMGLMLHSGGVMPGGVLTPQQEPFALKEKGFDYYVGTITDARDHDNNRNVLLRMKHIHQSTPDGQLNRRLFFQMVLPNLAQLGQIQESSLSYNETEVAEVNVMSWMKYVADKEVTERVADNKYMVLSMLLNGILATNAIMGNGVLRTAFRMVNLSGVLSTVSSPLVGLAKMMLPVLWTPAIATYAIGATLGVSGTFSALARTAGLLGEGYQDNASDGILSGVLGAFKNALFGISTDVFSNAQSQIQKSSQSVLDHLSYYLITNIYMYRVTVRFLHNGSKYVWKFDLGVDKATNTVLMYHGMQDKKQMEVTAYRDIKPDTDGDLKKIREHKKTQKHRRSRKRMSSATARNVYTRRLHKRAERIRKRDRRSRRRYHNQYRY